MAAERTSEKLAKSVRGEDKPISEKRPSMPLALVGAYPIALVIILLLIVLWLSYFGLPGR
ncbi:MAG: hypothetical protein ACTHK7_01595 [Aureliella sp.]